MSAGREQPSDAKRFALPLRASDGARLGGSLYEPAAHAEMTVLMVPGIGISQRLFRRIGAWLADQGVRAFGVDYRGIGESASLEGRRTATLTRWAQLDAAAAYEYCERQWREPVVLLAHSFGGQVLGLAPQLAGVRAAVLVGSQLGQPRNWDGWQRLRLTAYWHVVLPIACLLVDPLPPALAFGTELPRGAAREWGSWGRSRQWLLSKHPEARATFAAFRAPLRAYAVSDDAIAPRRAVAALLELLPQTCVDRRDLTPAELGLREIGHLGVFRNPECEPIWREILDFFRRSLEHDGHETTATQT